MSARYLHISKQLATVRQTDGTMRIVVSAVPGDTLRRGHNTERRAVGKGWTRVPFVKWSRAAQWLALRHPKTNTAQRMHQLANRRLRQRTHTL